SYNPSEIDRLNTAYVAFPGLIDAHTHLCWAGSRADDYALRLSGKSYLEIAAQSGGIWDTVQKTRNIPDKELILLVAERANALLKQGVTTIEVKSGYGLLVEQELRLLDIIRKADNETSAELISTCLAAHIVPKDFIGTEEKYLETVLKQLLPEVKYQRLSNRIDIFVDEGAFSVLAAKEYLRKAKAMGFEVLLHGDQFSTGAAQLAIEVGARSIDHLEAANDDEIQILAKGNVIPVALPGASLGLGEPFAPARKLLDAGASLAIASDWNPGSAPMGNLLVEAAILGVKEKLSMAETWAALTFRAAAALNLADRGILAKGNLADIAAFKTDNFKEILYQQGELKPEKVWKNGYRVI
ncbi:MAG TPA: imidazolonepropionase, partial [Prolixibacteraceae bacterium]|nr:imidazolonepropionase [Prolixibacteraceae bacterium]